MKKILLSVAGYDPTSGAEVTLDLKVFERLGFQGTAVLTSVTAQNTKGVKKVHGTGCFLSSSILAYLTKGKSLETACRLGTDPTHQAIKQAVRIGRGQVVIHLDLLRSG